MDKLKNNKKRKKKQKKKRYISRYFDENIENTKFSLRNGISKNEIHSRQIKLNFILIAFFSLYH